MWVTDRDEDHVRDTARPGHGASPDSERSADAALDLDSRTVAELFDRNATTYDWVNTLITFGRDARWRRWAAAQAVAIVSQASMSPASMLPPPSLRALDACAGTGLLALELARRGATVTAVDAAPRMLAVVRDRLGAAGLALRTVVADLSDEATPARLGGPFDVVTLAFGLRYFADASAPLRLLRKLLVPGGLLVVVEAVCPPQDPLGAVAGLYFFRVVPRLGTTLAGRADLYDALAASTRALGSADQLAAHLRSAGFSLAARQRFACGLVVGLVAAPV
jgi:demethylmenaquinone methyltransferase/2-methoxy-6-polyprenyl-1,4-benzoquinol methylase